MEKKKPIYSLNPVEVINEKTGEKALFVLLQDPKTGLYRVPIKEEGDKVITLTFKKWEDVKFSFDEKSRKIIEGLIKEKS